jgi:hypothetical protein
MTPPQSPTPAWVRKRDGRVVPFEADRISRALFAASETAGRPDAFLVRELADVVVHFLAEETEGTTPTTDQIHEVVVKVLRELQQPALAEAYEARARARRSNQHAPEKEHDQVEQKPSRSDASEAEGECLLRGYRLQPVYTRDLGAAHQDGIIALAGLETPDELAASLVGPIHRIEELLPRLEEAASVTGQRLALAGIEPVLSRILPASPKRPSRQRLEVTARGFAANLLLGLRLTRRQAVVNLNGPAPPCVDAVTDGPLFAVQGKGSDPERASLIAETLAQILFESGNPPNRIRVDWHLSEMDCSEKGKDRLLPLARAALVGAPLSFVFDRPRHPVALAEGLERKHPGVLLMVGLNLPRLATLVREELSDLPGRGERLLKRLGSLARLGLSAALQKRDYLRKHVQDRAGLTSGFLLERARLLVVPLGLDRSVRILLGQSLCSNEEAQELGSAILRRLRDVLREEGRASTLETCIDAGELGEAAGPTCWDHEAPVKNQLKTIGALHAAAGGGSGTVFLPQDPPLTADQLADWLLWAHNNTGIVRLHLRHARPALEQMTFSDT